MPRDRALVYIAAWSALVVVSVVMMIRERRDYGLLSSAYLRSLLVPWRLVTFVIAATFFVVGAPYTGDPTWDHVDGSFMSVLTYATAPWVVGVVVRARRRLVPRRQLFVALIVALFSASWSYDGYLLLRDGYYPSTWWSNIIASMTLYVSAGMFWSLTHVPGRGIVFDFMTEAWFATPPARFRKIVVFAVLLAAGAALAMVPFASEILAVISRRAGK